MLRLIHGNDEFSIANSLKAHLDAIGPPDLLAPNVTIFEAPNVRMEEVFAAASISPFLTERRAIVVKGMLAPMETRGANVRADWNSFGDRIANKAIQITNELIFVENSHLRLTSRSLKALVSFAEVETHDVPTRNERINWIRGRFNFHGVGASASALSRFSEIGGEDLRRLDSEIQKLAIYADGRELRPGDIDKMVADASQDRIFNVLDSIIEGRHSRALSGVQNLVANGESIEGILALLNRQIRNLIVAAYMLERGVPQAEVGRRLRLNFGWLINKTCQQASRIGSRRLRSMHLHLLDLDVSMKTGRLDRRLAIEALISNLISK